MPQSLVNLESSAECDSHLDAKIAHSSLSLEFSATKCLFSARRTLTRLENCCLPKVSQVPTLSRRTLMRPIEGEASAEVHASASLDHAHTASATYLLRQQCRAHFWMQLNSWVLQLRAGAHDQPADGVACLDPEGPIQKPDEPFQVTSFLE
jgi:hypothetical protein